MAKIVCSEDYLVLTSGSRLKVIPFSDPSYCEVQDLKVATTDTNVKTGVTKATDGAEGRQHTAHEIDPHVPTGRILTAALSRTGKLFAACTDQKEMTLWGTQPTWKKMWTRTVVKRCMALTFDTSESAVFVADKAGDVYQYGVDGEGKEAVLLLGHVSMLLDVVVSPDNRFILTAERDEKIRVSHLPNAYKIHTFCLGHTEFVSRLAILPESDLLISAAGDSTLRLWDYRSGKALCKASYDWARPSKGEEKLTEKNEATVTCISCSKKNSLIAVTILQHYCVPVYMVNEQENGQWSISEITRIECRHPPWSVTFDPKGRLLILLPDEERPLLIYRIDRKNDLSFQVDLDETKEGATAVLAQQVCSDWDFLKCSCGVQSVYQGLHKVPVDNMPDYLQRKQRRIETTKARRGRRKKAQRNKGQKRSKGNEEDSSNDDSSAKRTMREEEEVDDDDDVEVEGDDDNDEQNDDEDENLGNGGDIDKMEVEAVMS